MKAEITDRYLRSLTLPESGRIEVSDTKRTGLRFRLYASGKATWMYEKRIKGGVKRKHTFGTWPEQVSLSDARKMALELELEASKGIDRVENARRQKTDAERAKAQVKTLRSVLDAYSELHLSTLRTGDMRKRQLEVALETYLDGPVTALSRSDLQLIIDKKALEGHKVAPNRVRTALMAFASWAWGRSYLAENIGLGLAKPNKEVAREQSPSIDEVRAIWAATYSVGQLWGPIFRLLLLTTQRRGEILKLRVSEVKIDRAQIIKPGSQTKNGKAHITHLSPPALTEAQSALDRAVEQGTEFVFTTTGKTPVSGISRAKDRLDKVLGNSVAPWRLHDIRTSFATAMAEAGEPENVIDRILNHVASGSAPSAVSRVYNQAEMLPQRAAALDRWAEMVTGESSKVVELHG